MSRLADTLQTKYGEGVTKPVHIEAVKNKIKATNLERYGAESPFSKGSILYDKVREASDAARTVLTGLANPFSWPEVQEKIRATNLAKYGVENPNQNPQVRAKAQATNRERYGSEESLASPVVRRRIVATNRERYGGPSPSNSPEVVEKARQTNLERWGVEWTSQHPEVRQKQYETQIDHYGSLFFASDEGRSRIKQALIERYGVDHPSKIEGFWNKTVTTFVRKYGATHPLLLAEFLDKRRDTCRERYGVDSPLQSPEIYAQLVGTVKERYGVENVFQAESVKEKARQTNIEVRGVPYAIMSEEVKEKARQTNIAKYGFPHPMMNREYARVHLERMGLPGPNLLERRFASLNPELLYTGNGTFWRWLSKLGHHKNPDFILPGPDPKHPKKGVVKVVEVFGDFWHSRMFTGKSNFAHESELVEAFKEAGLDCLVVWESAIKEDSGGVRAAVQRFLTCAAAI